MRHPAAWTLGTVLALSPAATAQVPLGPEFAVNAGTVNGQFNPSVAMDAAGNFVVTWDAFFGGANQNEVIARRFAANGTPLSAEFLVNYPLTYNHDQSRVAAAPGGEFVVVWVSFQQPLTTQPRVFGRRYAANGSALGLQFTLHPTGQGNEGSPSVSMDPSGGFVAAWDSTGPGFNDREIVAVRYDASGVLQGSPFVVNAQTFGRQANPSVAWQPGGGFVVAWESDDLDNSGLAVRGRRFDAAGQALGQEFTVNSYTTGNQAEPAIAVNPVGSFVVAWTSVVQDGTGPDGPGVFAQQFGPTGFRIPSELRANTYTTGGQARPAIGMDGISGFTVVWNSTGEDGDAGGVFARRFSLGIPGPPIQVNTYTTGAQVNPAIAVHPNGDFVVVWHSPQDGSGAGIVGRRFGPDWIFRDGFELQN
jgi:hypothetical protein